ncbi:glycine receptor subunit alpha-3-like, partial [Ctenocephalides felis]|uniref:glycine receptor subunit alpha-3-like n=1 Tax=Ctenocephalides felis TaxID=7515 RepID=UPI000E6E4B60
LGKYNTSELLLTWEPTAQVTLAPELHLTEYVLTDMWVNETVVKADLDDLRHGAFGGTYSALSFTIQISREMGYYLMDYFLPSVMIVSCSWVSFWLAADQSAPRVTLGTSTMLSFITLASAQGKTLPKVSYIKASEIWFLGCTGFIFGSLVEFAFVNTIWRRRKNVELKKVNSKYILKSTLTPRLARKEFHASFNSNPGGGNKDDQDLGRGIRVFPPPLVKARSCSSLDRSNGSGNFLSVHGNDHKVPTITAQCADDAASDQISVCVDGENEEPAQIVHHTWTTMTPQEISMWIDKRSRICFPIAFAIFNFFYWIFVYYL